MFKTDLLTIYGSLMIADIYYYWCSFQMGLHITWTRLEMGSI